MLSEPSLSLFDWEPATDEATADPATQNLWRTDRHRVEFRANAPLSAGWYRFRMQIDTPLRVAVRKQAQLFATVTGEEIPLDRFEWNDHLHADLLLRLAQPVTGLRLTLRHCNPEFTIRRLELGRTSRTRTVVQAVRLKVGLLRSYSCFWPVVSRGGRLLKQGRFREFGEKLLRGISDSRTMRIEVKRAEELAAMWWRRKTISSDQLAAMQANAEDIPNPEPLGVLLPVDATRVDHARQAMLSVLRQAYPHWELFVLYPENSVPTKLSRVAAHDTRVQFFTGRSGSLTQTLQALQSPRAIILPPDWELTEDALLQFAQTAGEVVTCRTQSSDTTYRPAVISTAKLRQSVVLHTPGTVPGILRWATEQIPEAATCVSELLAVPINGSRAVETSIPMRRTTQLMFSADIRGLSGWDHVAFALLKGLASVGVPIVHHAAANVAPELLPPHLQFPKVKREREQPQLVTTPPFLLGRFGIDDTTAVVTMWETDRLQPAEVKLLNRARVVIVPSAWGAGCFRRSGVTAPIEVVPLGYDPQVFSPVYQRPAVCTFGTAGALSQGGLRKNVRRVVELFSAAFPTQTDVRLRVKITPNCPPFEVAHDPRVEILRASLPYPELAMWNRSLTAYVNASFAEGFGFHLLEAMACGVPLISSHYSGLTEYFDHEVGYVVPHRIIEARNEIYSGNWADPDDDALIEAMRRVYHQRDEAAQFAERAAARARRFTWRDTGRQLLRVLERYHLLERAK